MMTTTKIEAVFAENIGRVWEVVTSLSTSEWRSDLNSIEVSDDQKSFIEYTKQGYPTKLRLLRLIRRSFTRSQWKMTIYSENGPMNFKN